MSISNTKSLENGLENTKSFLEKIMNFPYGSKIELNGAELTFTKIEKINSGSVLCVFKDSEGITFMLTQLEVEQALGL